MNKKQAFIIATLLVLIVCAGILATKVNSPLYVDNSEIAQDTNASADRSDFYTEQKLVRQQKFAETVPTYKTVIEDPNTTKETKDAFVQKLKEFTTNNTNEQKVETELKGKGYDETFCQISEGKVMVYVKAEKEKFSDKNARDIKNIVLGITKIKDVEIALK